MCVFDHNSIKTISSLFHCYRWAVVIVLITLIVIMFIVVLLFHFLLPRPEKLREKRKQERQQQTIPMENVRSNYTVRVASLVS